MNPGGIVGKFSGGIPERITGRANRGITGGITLTISGGVIGGTLKPWRAEGVNLWRYCRKNVAEY